MEFSFKEELVTSVLQLGKSIGAGLATVVLSVQAQAWYCIWSINFRT
jgi:hypothetical protein